MTKTIRLFQIMQLHYNPCANFIKKGQRFKSPPPQKNNNNKVRAQFQCQALYYSKTGKYVDRGRLVLGRFKKGF